MKTLTFKLFCAVVACTALSCASAFSQNLRQDFALKSFSAIEVSDDFDVTVIKGSDYYLELTVDEALKDYVHHTIKNSTLIIDLDDKKVPNDIKKMFKGKAGNNAIYRAIITMPGDLKSVKLNDKASLLVNQDIMSEGAVSVELKDNSTLRSMVVKATNVSINLEKKATATLNVTCDQLAVETSGSSNLTLSQTSKNLDIKSSGNSNLTVKGETGELDYQVKGTTKATISGKGQSATFNCAGSSNTNAVDFDLNEAVVEMNSICTLTEAACEKLSVSLSGGANLIFANAPVLDIKGIKSSSMSHYEGSK